MCRCGPRPRRRVNLTISYYVRNKEPVSEASRNAHDHLREGGKGMAKQNKNIISGDLNWGYLVYPNHIENGCDWVAFGVYRGERIIGFIHDNNPSGEVLWSPFVYEDGEGEIPFYVIPIMKNTVKFIFELMEKFDKERKTYKIVYDEDGNAVDVGTT